MAAEHDPAEEEACRPDQEAHRREGGEAEARDGERGQDDVPDGTCVQPPVLAFEVPKAGPEEEKTGGDPEGELSNGQHVAVLLRSRR